MCRRQRRPKARVGVYVTLSPSWSLALTRRLANCAAFGARNEVR